MATPWQKIGEFRAIVNPRFDCPPLRQSLAGILEIAGGPDATLLQAGRHRTIRLPLPCADGSIDAVAKIFGAQSPFKDLWDRLHATKARRTFDAAAFLAEAGIGTTPPIACLERWRSGRLSSSVFVSAFVPDSLCFKDWLVDLWRRNAPYSAFLEAIERAATGIRALHDAGCAHGDLGNQNVFFTRRGPGLPYRDALFLDLNRARFSPVPLDSDERARDLARICLPPGFFDAFFRLYWGGTPPLSFLAQWRKCARRFRIHSATRKFRHPFRELSYRLDPRKAPAQAAYPPPERQWVWDDAARRPAPVAPDAELAARIEPSFRRSLFSKSRQLARRYSPRTLSARPQCIDFPDSAPALRRIVLSPDALGAIHGRLARANSRSALARLSPLDNPGDVAKVLEAARSLAAGGAGVAFQFQQAPGFTGAEPIVEFADRIVSGCGFTPDWISVGQGVNSPAWAIRSREALADFIAASGHFATSRHKWNVVSAAVDSPVFGPCCACIEALFSKNAPYSALALACDGGPQAIDSESRALRAFASGTFYARRRIVAISSSPLPLSYRPAPPIGEVCAPEFS